MDGMGWDGWMGLDMVIIGRRLPKSTFGANNMVVDLFLARAKIPITLSSSTHEHIHSVVRKIPLKDKDW